MVAPPQLHPAILRTIRQWFELVDEDGSETLEHHELQAALEVRGLEALGRSAARAEARPGQGGA